MTTRLEAMQAIADEQMAQDESGRMSKEEYLGKSNERLKTIMLKKVDTTMIGALSVIEAELKNVHRTLSKQDSITLEDAYARIRSKILDNGNNQKRAIAEEMKHYTVNWNMYTVTLPVRQKREGGFNPYEYDEFVIIKEGK